MKETEARRIYKVNTKATSQNTWLAAKHAARIQWRFTNIQMIFKYKLKQFIEYRDDLKLWIWVQLGPAVLELEALGVVVFWLINSTVAWTRPPDKVNSLVPRADSDKVIVGRNCWRMEEDSCWLRHWSIDEPDSSELDNHNNKNCQGKDKIEMQIVPHQSVVVYGDRNATDWALLVAL